MRRILFIYFLVFISCQKKGTIDTNLPQAYQNSTTKPYYSKPQLPKSKNNSFIIVNATIIDGLGQPSLDNQTVIIEHGIIKKIGDSHKITPPEGLTIINAKGKTLIPGLVGVHNHLHIPQFPFVGLKAAQLYLANGVTSIQTCGAALPNPEIRLAKNIALGKIIGPDIYTSGPFITGKGGNINMIIPKSEDHLRDTLNYWIEKGVQWFKAYRHIEPKYLKLLIEQSHQNNVKVAAHLCSITFEDAIRMQVDKLEHGLNSISDFRHDKTEGICNGSRTYIDSLDLNSSEVQHLLDLMVEKKIALTSTLAIYESSIPQRVHVDEISYNIMSPYLKKRYLEHKQSAQKNSDSTRLRRMKRIMNFEYQFYKKGGLLTAGVDAGRHVLPGFGDLRNFELLIDAGFTVEEAIKIMTSNGAAILGDSKIGSIALEQRANLVLINGNLKQQPNNINNIHLVFKDGYAYNPSKILSHLNNSFGVN